MPSSSFEFYAALLEHYKAKHPNANLTDLQHNVASEREAHVIYETSMRHHTHGFSRLKLLAFLLIVIVAISFSSYAAFAPKSSVRLGTKSISVSVGNAAPDFSLPATLGQSFRLSDYRDKSNVLLFFNEGLACQPCLTQMQGLDALNSEFNGLNVVVVSITGDSLQILKDWAQNSGPRHGLVLSDQNLQVSGMYDMLGPNVSMMPGSAPGHSFILVNKEGMIIWRQDYGPYNMSVPNNEIIAAVNQPDTQY